MKKIIALFISAILLLSMASCGIEPINGSSEKSNSTDSDKQIEIDENLTTIDITIPALYMGDDFMTTGQLTEEQKQQGFILAKTNDDGTVTCKIKKGDWKKAMKKYEEGIDESINELVTSGDYPSVKKISHNRSYTKFTFEVDKESFENSMDSASTWVIAMGVGLYLGFSQKEAKFSFDMKDTSTGKVFKTMNYPDDFQM